MLPDTIEDSVYILVLSNGFIKVTAQELFYLEGEWHAWLEDVYDYTYGYNREYKRKYEACDKMVVDDLMEFRKNC